MTNPPDISWIAILPLLLVVLADSVMESRLDLRGNLAFSDYVVQTNELQDELPDAIADHARLDALLP